VRQLAEKPERVKSLFRYENMIKDIMAINLNLVTLQQEDFIAALRIQRDFGLMTNDSLFIAVAERLRIKSIASADKRLANVSGFSMYSPDDIVQR
jgi:predicted nucleic acid-binding protein